MQMIRRTAKRAKSIPKTALALAALQFGRVFDKGATTGYARDLSGVAPIAQPDRYLRPQEVEDADEDTLFEDLKTAFASDVQPGRGAADLDHQDLHWGHTTGYLRGELTIDATDGLDPEFRVGLFSEDRIYPVVARPNFLYDDDPLIAISRLSVKIRYDRPGHNEHAPGDVSQEIDLLLSEGLPPGGETDGRGFFFRDARQLLMANDMKTGWASRLGTLANGASGRVVVAWTKIFKGSTDGLYKPPQSRLGWAGKHYFSAGPYALGDGVMKFSLVPRQVHDLGEDLAVDLDNPARRHKAEFWPRDLQGASGEDRRVAFDLCVQVATQDCIDRKPGDPPAGVMAVEYTDLAWDESKAPFVRVGTLELRPLPPGTETETWYAIPFNAWNTLDCMRPLGQLFRARRLVHAHHRGQRLEHSFGDAPSITAWTCPFSSKGRD